MVRGLLAPLSLREISQLLHLLQGKDFQPDPTVFKRFVMLGLVEEKLDGSGLPVGLNTAPPAPHTKVSAGFTNP
jgi:hypothetical protein